MHSLIHEKSQTITLPKFDLFSIPPTQQTVERYIITEHKPISALDASSFVQFEIHTAFDEYLDLEKLFLYLKLKFKPIEGLKDGEDGWTDIKHLPYFMHSMIKQLDIFINETQISTSTPNYGYKSYIEALFGFNKHAKESHLSTAIWDENEKLTDGYTPFELYGRLHSDLVYQSRVLLGGCKLTIRLLFQDPKFYFITTKYQPALDFLEASIRVIRYKVPQHFLEAHDEALRISPAKYIISASRVKTFTIMEGTTDINIDNIHSGQLPKRIFIMMVRNNAYNGTYDTHGYKFEHFFLNSLALYVNGEQIPPKPYTPDFSKKLFMRELTGLYESMGMLYGESNMNINRQNFTNNMSIFGFNISQDQSNGPLATGYANLIRYGAVSLSLRFADKLDATITVILYIEFDKILEIDITRNAKIDLY